MQIPYLNALRGIAILMVILVHVSQLFFFGNESISNFFDMGKFGVQLFFLVSAYTLCLSHDHRKSEKNATKKFYIRRYFRIFPIYYLGIFVYGLLNYATNIMPFKNYTFKNVVANFTFTHGIIPTANNSIVPGGWSIGAEMLFYMIFPLLIESVKKGFLLKAFVLALISTFLNFILSKYNLITGDFVYFNFLNQFTVFLFGICIYKLRNVKINNVLLAIVLVVFGYITFLINGQHTDTVQNHYIATIVLPLFAAIFLGALFKLASQGFFNWTFFQKVGNYSYSMYITHFIFAFYIFPKFDAGVLIVPIYISTVVLSYTLAIPLYRFEKFFIQIGSNINAGL